MNQMQMELKIVKSERRPVRRMPAERVEKNG